MDEQGNVSVVATFEDDDLTTLEGLPLIFEYQGYPVVALSSKGLYSAHSIGSNTPPDVNLISTLLLGKNDTWFGQIAGAERSVSFVGMINTTRVSADLEVVDATSYHGGSIYIMERDANQALTGNMSLDRISFGDGYITFDKEFQEVKRSFYIKDHLGSTRMVIHKSDQGTVLQEGIRYDAYGGEIDDGATRSSEESRERYTGKELDKDGALNDGENVATGIQLSYFSARYLDSDVGIFISPDPAGEFWNSYRYTTNPINFTDPTGMQEHQLDWGPELEAGDGYGIHEYAWMSFESHFTSMWDGAVRIYNQHVTDFGGALVNDYYALRALGKAIGDDFRKPFGPEVWDRKAWTENNDVYNFIHEFGDLPSGDQYRIVGTGIGYGAAFGAEALLTRGATRVYHATKGIGAGSGIVVNNPFSICFLAGTLVSTKKGLKPIESVTPNDSVWAYNEITKKVELCSVVQTFTNITDTVVAVSVNVHKIECTLEHPFYVVGKGWTPARDLQEGFKVQTEYHTTVAISTIEIAARTEVTYNFEVQGLHNYFVSKSRVLVHNTSKVTGPDGKIQIVGARKGGFHDDFGYMRGRVPTPVGGALGTDPRDLLVNGQLKVSELMQLVPPGTPNLWKIDPLDGNLGFSYKFRYNNINYHIKGHGPQPSSVGVNSSTMWTGQIKIRNRFLQDNGGTTRNRFTNETHIPLIYRE